MSCASFWGSYIGVDANVGFTGVLLPDRW